jgi:hypothetical protein
LFLVFCLWAMAALQSPAGQYARPGPAITWQGRALLAARPNPQNRGNCFQWKRCRGETIGNMWIGDPGFCGPLGGKSWKAPDGRCLDLLEAPWSVDPGTLPPPPGPLGAWPAPGAVFPVSLSPGLPPDLVPAPSHPANPCAQELFFIK